jgi:bacteriocin-like protein
MNSTVARVGQPTAANDLWKPVSANELAQIEGGLFGISWNDVKRAAKYVASQILKRL